MNFFQRAFKNVTRKYSKSILLIITFFFIGNLVIVGLGVANAAENAKILTRKKMRAVVSYKVDNDAVFQYADTITDQEELEKFYANFPKIKLTNVKDLIADKRVATANAVYSTTCYKVNEFDYVHLNNSAEENMENFGQECEILPDGSQTCRKSYYNAHMIKGNMFPNMIEFVDGGYELVDGRFYNQEEIDNGDNVVLISSALADTNDLNVGDYFSIYTSSPNDVERYKEYGASEDSIRREFKIVGIFDHQDKVTPGSSNFDYLSPFENVDNLLLMPATSLYLAQLEINQMSFDYYSDRNDYDDFYSDSNRPSEEKMDDIDVNDVTFLLNDPLEVEKFVDDYQSSLPQFMMLDAKNEEFKRLSKPLDTLGLYANFIIWLVVVNAIIIISLVTALTLKTREYEIGVMLAIGTAKLKIVAQFFIELALVAVVGFSLSVVSGSLIAKKVGQTVLEYQIQESDVQKDTNNISPYQSIWDNDYSTSVTLDDLVSEYDVSISPIIILEIYGLGLGIVFISIIIPSMMIMRFNPKKILMNQN